MGGFYHYQGLYVVEIWLIGGILGSFGGELGFSPIRVSLSANSLLPQNVLDKILIHILLT